MHHARGSATTPSARIVLRNERNERVQLHRASTLCENQASSVFARVTRSCSTSRTRQTEAANSISQCAHCNSGTTGSSSTARALACKSSVLTGMAARAYGGLCFPDGDGSDCQRALRRLDGTKEAWVITSDLDFVPGPVRQACADTYPANPLKHFAVVVLDRTSHTWFKLERTRADVAVTIVRLDDITALSKTAGYTFEARGCRILQFLDCEGRHGYDLLLNNCQVFAHNFWKEFVDEEVDFQAFFEWVGTMPPCDSFKNAVQAAARGPAAAGTVLPITLGPTGRKLVAGTVQLPADLSHFTTRRKIVVFGQAGTGKSSMINAITGSKLATGDGVGGVTRTHRAVERSYPTDTGDRMDLCIFDTAGLDESAEGTVNPVEAVDTLVKLFRGISGGVNLLVFVLRRGRALSKLLEYYKMFANDVGGGRVPILAVVTGCEDRAVDADLQSWLSDRVDGVQNKEMLRKLGIVPAGFACTSFADPKSRLFTQEDCDKSVTIVLEKIHKLSAGEPIVLCGQSLTEVAKFIYRSTNNVLEKLASLFSFSKIPKMAFGVPRTLVDIYKRAGASEQDATSRAAEVALGKKRDDILINLEKFGYSDEDIQAVLSSALIVAQQRGSST
ncbi:unnamed protein product [Ectocarpus sp. CCAP 1310/34]|nr:unnamed protein product [Ectocarpus sp. CCAP 1310/34]